MVVGAFPVVRETWINPGRELLRSGKGSCFFGDRKRKGENRMSNRAQRRAMMRSETNRSKKLEEIYRDQIAAMGRQERIAGLCKNGITPNDVRGEYERGRKTGFRQAAEAITKCCYAGVILALKEEFGFDEDQLFRAITAVDKKIVWSIDHSELSERVLKETGLRLDLDDPLERVIREG